MPTLRMPAVDPMDRLISSATWRSRLDRPRWRRNCARGTQGCDCDLAPKQSARARPCLTPPTPLATRYSPFKIDAPNYEPPILRGERTSSVIQAVITITSGMTGIAIELKRSNSSRRNTVRRPAIRPKKPAPGSQQKALGQLSRARLRRRG